MSIIDNFKEKGMNDSVTEKEVSTLVKIAIPASLGAIALSAYRGQYFFAGLMFVFVLVLVLSLKKMESNGGFNEKANTIENYGASLISEGKSKYDAALNGIDLNETDNEDESVTLNEDDVK